MVLEGIDGAGKTTQVARVVDYLCQLLGDDKVVRTQDLGGSPLGESLKKIMYEVVPPRDMAPCVLDLVFLAGHVQNWHKLVKPAMDEGKVVVSDRWWLSQFAYARGREHDDDAMELYDKKKGAWPNLTIFLYGDPAVLLGRANARPDSGSHQKQKDWNKVDAQSRVICAYFELYQHRPGWSPILVDDLSIDQVWSEVKDLLLREMCRPSWPQAKEGVGP